jgi:hypothetical protein
VAVAAAFSQPAVIELALQGDTVYGAADLGVASRAAGGNTFEYDEDGLRISGDAVYGAAEPSSGAARAAGVQNLIALNDDDAVYGAAEITAV